MDFDNLYDLGEDGNFVYTIVEIPKGSTQKIEYDREKKTFILDRIEPAIFAKPVNYGFIPKTTDEDGDPLDTLIVTEESLTTGIVLKAKVIGMLDFQDDGENDHKIVCVPLDDRNNGSIETLDDLSDQFKKQIEHHFSHYKDLKKPGSTIVKGWGDASMAWGVIKACSDRYKKEA